LTSRLLALTFGLLAAFLFAASAALQQQAARGAVNAAPPPDRNGVTAALPVLRTARRLVRDRIWLLGTAANVAGSLVQAAALYFGSVAVVQVLLVSQLVFTLWLAALRDHRRPGGRELGSAVAIWAGIVIFLSVPGAAPAGGPVDRWRILVATACAAALVGLLVLTAVGRHRAVRAIPIAIGAGVFFAISAALLKITIEDLLDRGVAATAVDWPGYSLAGSALAGLLLEQAAFAGGPMPWAVAGMSVTNPVASLAVGLLAFQVPVPDDPRSLTTIAVSGALVAVGIAGLAHSPTMQHLYGSRAWSADRPPAPPPAAPGALRPDGDHADEPRAGGSSSTGTHPRRTPTSGHPCEEMR